MNKKEYFRLLEKFKINKVGNGQFGDGFLEGLQFAEKFYEKSKKVKK